MTTVFPPPQGADAALAKGSSLHRAGSLYEALVEFESALVHAPQRVDLMIARSAVLLDLGLSHAAWQAIESKADTLGNQRTHATNVAIFAESAGELQQARQAYERALLSAPEDLRALNNLALLDAKDGQWDSAIARACECAARAPHEPVHAFTLADILINARRPEQALEHLGHMHKQFGNGPGIGLRAAIATALLGNLAQAHQILKPLGNAGLSGVRDFMRYNHTGRQAPPEDLIGVFMKHGVHSLQECRWDVLPALEAVLTQVAASLGQAPAAQDLRSFITAGRTLGWPESRWQALRAATARHFAQIAPRIAPPLPAASWKPKDTRIRIGLLLPTLDDHPESATMCDLLLALDPREFAIHVYCPHLPPADDADWTSRRARLASMIELAFMNPGEMIGRIRLDRLDVAIDATAMTPWSLEAVLHARIANVQVQAPGLWLTQASPYDYVVADAVTHAAVPLPAAGRLAHMPATCWLGRTVMHDAPPLARDDLGLPADKLLLCANAPASHIDPGTFALWMRLLQGQPDAVLWLPGHVTTHTRETQANLTRTAGAFGVPAQRLIFTVAPPLSQLAHQLKLADLYVDTTRISSTHGLAHALQAGVPALTLTGQTIASRMGASLLHAAGLGELVADDEDSYVNLGIALLGDAGRRAVLRQRLTPGTDAGDAADATSVAAPWAQALRIMADHGRNMSPPVTFTVTAA